MYVHATKLSFCILMLEDLACLECSVFIYLDLLGYLVTYQLIVTTYTSRYTITDFCNPAGV